MSLRVVFIDNFDSFTWNLVDEFARRGAMVEVWRNTVSAAHALARAQHGEGPSLLVLSPGPGAPKDAGCCLELVRLAEARVPLFGVCLGHQAIIEAYGGTIGSAGEILHGKTSEVSHQGATPFEGLSSPLKVGRYHSLGAFTVPEPLRPIAMGGPLVMGVTHRTAPVLGIQFHPESILTPEGSGLIANVLRWAERYHADR
jgi:anthranilate synthase component 2